MKNSLGVFLDVATVNRNDLNMIKLQNVLPDWRFYDYSEPGQIAERIKFAHVVVANKARLDESVLENAQRLHLICVAATGTNNVDMAAAIERGITVCNVRNYATPSVAQHVISMMLNLSTNFIAYHTAVKQGAWALSRQFCLLDFPINELAGKVLGIIGYGDIGHAVAKIAEAMGMEVIVAERKGRKPREDRLTFEEVIKTADIITLHCPLTEETKGLIGAQELEQMKKNALLINAARGGIVDEAALVDALHKNDIAGAAVDVLTQEPPHDGNVLLKAKLNNLLISPHVAWASVEARQRLVNELAANIQAFLQENPRNVVKP
jgi:glycerate dehydrogenase